MASVALFNLGVAGIEKDIPPHLLPPEVWSNGNNFRMQDGFLVRHLGHAAILDPPNVPPGFIMAVPGLDESFWLYADLVSVHAYAGGVHADITRGSGAYTADFYRSWNGVLFGGVPIVNNGIDVPQWWSDLSLAQDLDALPDWPSNLRAKVIRNFGPFLVALNLKEDSDLLPHALQWSSRADPGTVPASWDPTDPTVDTGRVHLTDVRGGVIVDAYLLGSFLIIYKERSTHIMRFIGGQNIMGFDLLFNQGLIGPRGCAIIDSGAKHVCLGENQVYVHSGTKALDYPLTRKNQRILYSDMDQDNKKNAFIFEDPIFEEAWICYPSIGNEFPNKALVWNYRNNSQGFREFDGMSADIGEYADDVPVAWDDVSEDWNSQTDPWNAQGNRRLLVASNSSDKIWSMDTGLQYGSVVDRQAFVQRTGLAVVGKDRQGQPKADYSSRKLGKRIWPKIVGDDAVVNVRLGKQEEINGEITWATAKQFVPAQKYLDFEVNGRLLAVEMTALNDAECRIDGYDLEIEILGVL